jgi:anti-sigma regulatory factor (Ser/Thr protein kinase)
VNVSAPADLDRPGSADPHDHGVAFYRGEAEVVAEVAAFVAGGLAAGGGAVVVATASHREAIDAALERHGHDAASARADGRYTALDAAETLAEFMSTGGPDAARFEAVIGDVIDGAAADGRPVRVFGEMVALLWDEGNVTGALELESLWNELATGREFSLLCAYPSAALGSASLHDANEVCRLHSQVRSLAIGATSTTHRDAANASEVFVATAASVREARLFVTGVLGSWGATEFVEDAALIVAELTANAVKHAASAFRVAVHRTGARVRIAVEDSGAGHPKPRAAGPNDPTGRGLALVARLADEWGWDSLPAGKSVWAELAERPIR